MVQIPAEPVPPPLNSAPEAGQVVRVRSRQYLVEEVEAPANPSRDQTLVSLSCLDDDAQGVPLQVLWEREVDAEIVQGSNWQEVASRGFDPPHLFSAFLHTLRWNLVTSTNPRLFQSPYRSARPFSFLGSTCSSPTTLASVKPLRLASSCGNC